MMTISESRTPVSFGARPAGQPGPTFQELLDREIVPVPAPLREQSIADLGVDDVDRHRYFTREFMDLEAQRLWSQTWQMVCREEEIANPGDVFVYEVVKASYLVVRVSPDVIKAYPNACLHRGRQLRSSHGHVNELRCPYHNFCWSLDGQLRDITCEWDFPQINRAEFALPDTRCETWQGFVWINPDPAAPPLSEYLGGVIGHFDAVAQPSLDGRFKVAHITKPIRANWKLGLEAFIEGFHPIGVHPQIGLWSGDVNSQTDVWPTERHWSRLITPLGVPSPSLAGIDEQEVADSFLVDLLSFESVPVPEGATARDVIGTVFREFLTNSMGLDTTGLTTSQLVDSIGYFIFPNIVVFAGVIAGFVFVFRPDANDPELSTFEALQLMPLPPGTPKMAGAPVHRLGPEESVAEGAPELGQFGRIVDQDLNNLPHVQRGLRAMTKPGVTLSRYQEARIRHFHQVLDQYVSDR